MVAPSWICVGTNCAAVFHFGARIEIVGEYSIRTDEYMIAQRNAVPYGYAILDRDTIANRDARLDESMIANIAVLADGGALHHVSERPHARALANVVSFYQSLRMYEVRFRFHRTP